MASSDSGIQKLIGTWDFVNGEKFDEYLQEVGIPWLVRQAVKAVKREKVIISRDNNGKWTLKSESTFKNSEYEFTPDVAFNETRPDGAEVKSTITFDNETGRWIHIAIDKQGKQVRVERYIDDKDQQQVELTCGKVTARRWYKRVA